MRRLILFACTFFCAHVAVALANGDDKNKVEAPPGYEDAPDAGAAQDREGERKKVRVVVPARVQPARPNRVDRVNANLKNLELQFRPQFQQIYKAERAFIPRVCPMTPEQRRELADSTERALDAAVHEFALAQNNRRNVRGRVVGGVVQQGGMPSPQALLHKEFREAIKEVLGPKEAARYHAEVTRRAEHEKRATVLNLVAKLDQQLLLTTKQREQMTASLTKNWQDSWAQSLQLFANNNQYLPMIPDQAVVPILNSSQVRVWKSMPKTNVGFVNVLQFHRPRVVVDDFDVATANPIP